MHEWRPRCEWNVLVCIMQVIEMAGELKKSLVERGSLVNSFACGAPLNQIPVFGEPQGPLAVIMTDAGGGKDNMSFRFDQVNLESSQ